MTSASSCLAAGSCGGEPAGGSEKRQLRQYYRRRRLEALPACEGPLQQQLLALVQQWQAAERLGPTGGHLGLYWPLAGEADLRPVLTAQPDLQLALPAVDGGHLHYRAWGPEQTLLPDACGIPAPTGEALAASALTLLLIPALAIDHRGIRLGYGGGWYDRLRSQPAWRRPTALAVLPSICCTEVLPADAWDIPLDGWLSEQGCHWIGPQP